MHVVKTPAILDDLYGAPDDGCTYELVNGELVKMAPTGEEPSNVSFEIAVSLREYAQRIGKGRARADGVAYTVDLPRRRSFSPDASFSYTYTPGNMRFVSGAPVFAVEVRSAHDYGATADREYADKRRDYFAAGTAVVWDVDPVARTVTKYRAAAPDTPTLFHADDIADAEPALPGWAVASVTCFHNGLRGSF